MGESPDIRLMSFLTIPVGDVRPGAETTTAGLMVKPGQHAKLRVVADMFALELPQQIDVVGPSRKDKCDASSGQGLDG